MGRFAALAVGSDGLGIISYYDATQSALKVAHCSDTACSTAAITVVAAANVMGQTSIAIGADGLPLIAYVRQLQSNFTTELMAAHCSNAPCSSATVTPVRPLNGAPFPPLDTAIAIGTDGFGAHHLRPGRPDEPAAGIAHCANTACTVLTPGPSPEVSPVIATLRRPSVIIGADGLGLVSYRRDSIPGGGPTDVREYRLRHCADIACTTFAEDHVPSVLFEGPNAPLVLGPDGKPWFAPAEERQDPAGPM